MMAQDRDSDLREAFIQAALLGQPTAFDALQRRYESRFPTLLRVAMVSIAEALDACDAPLTNKRLDVVKFLIRANIHMDIDAMFALADQAPDDASERYAELCENLRDFARREGNPVTKDQKPNTGPL